MSLLNAIREEIVAIENAGIKYPQDSCNPSEYYPEYIWGEDEVATEPNMVYSAI